MADAAGAKLKLGGAADGEADAVAGVSEAFLPKSPKLNPLEACFAGCAVLSADCVLPSSPKLKLAAGVCFVCSDEESLAAACSPLFWAEGVPKLKPLATGLGCEAVSVLSRLPKLKLPPAEGGLESDEVDAVDAGASTFLPRSPKLKVGLPLAAAACASTLGALFSTLIVTLEPNPLKALDGAEAAASAEDAFFGFGAGGKAKKSEDVLVAGDAPASFELADPSAPPEPVACGRATATPLCLDLVVVEERMLLGLELVARPPGWNGVSFCAGRSNIPAGTELSLPKLIVESVAPPKGEVVGAGPAVDAGADLSLCAAGADGVGVIPKPENGAGDALTALAAGELKPPKLKGVEEAAAFWVEVAGAAAAGVPELGVDVLPKPATKSDPAGFGEDAAGEPSPPKFRSVGAAVGFGPDAAAGAPVGGGAAVEPKPAKGADAGLPPAVVAGEPEAPKLRGVRGAAAF